MGRRTAYIASLGSNFLLLAALALILLGRREHAASLSINRPIASSSAPQSFLSSRVPVASVLPPYSSENNTRQWFMSLRDAGLPDKILARVILAESEARWQMRFDSCQEKTMRGEADIHDFNALSLARDKENEAELRAALGEEGYKQWDSENLLRTLNPQGIPLSIAEADALYKIKTTLQTRLRDLQEAELNGTIDSFEYSEARDKAKQEYELKIQDVLGEERKALAQNDDSVVSNLTQQIAKLNPSEEQIKELTKAHLEWSEKTKILAEGIQQDTSLEARYDDQLRALEMARDKAYKAILGDAAFDTFIRQKDSRFRNMTHYAKAWGLDEPGINYIFDTIRNYESGVRESRSKALALETQGQTVDWDSVKKSQEQAAEQIRLSLKTYLGQERYTKLERNEIIP